MVGSKQYGKLLFPMKAVLDAAADIRSQGDRTAAAR
jgi:hypothetical protein